MDLKSKRTYFNWSELNRLSNEENEAIIVLTYALYVGYNKLMAQNSQDLCKILKIPKIPAIVYSHRKITQKSRSTYNQIYSHYYTTDPQSYFQNPRFLIANIPLKYKIEYLYLLSLRSPYHTDNKIPITYLQTQNVHNPFTKRDSSHITFILEQEIHI